MNDIIGFTRMDQLQKHSILSNPSTPNARQLKSIEKRSKEKPNKTRGDIYMEQADINDLINNYIAAWNEADQQVRKKLLEAVWEKNGDYTDSISHASNRVELDAIISQFLGDNHGARFTLIDKIDFHHNHVRFYWLLQLDNGTEMIGMDYGRISADEKLERIVGFF